MWRDPGPRLATLSQEQSDAHTGNGTTCLSLCNSNVCRRLRAIWFVNCCINRNRELRGCRQFYFAEPPRVKVTGMLRFDNSTHAWSGLVCLNPKKFTAIGIKGVSSRRRCAEYRTKPVWHDKRTARLTVSRWKIH